MYPELEAWEWHVPKKQVLAGREKNIAVLLYESRFCECVELKRSTYELCDVWFNYMACSVFIVQNTSVWFLFARFLAGVSLSQNENEAVNNYFVLDNKWSFVMEVLPVPSHLYYWRLLKAAKKRISLKMLCERPHNSAVLNINNIRFLLGLASADCTVDEDLGWNIQ